MVSTNIRLDKLKAIIRFPSHAGSMFPGPNTHAGITLRAIIDWVHGCTTEYKPGAKWWKSSKGAMTFATYPLNSLTSLTVAYGWSPKGKNAFATFQFNPSYLCQDAVTELGVQFGFMFNNEYEEFFNTATIKHIEIALDVHGVQKESCLFLDRKVRTYSSQFEGKGTTYLGGEDSKYQLCIYDRRKKIADDGVVPPSEPWTRIEATLQNTEMKLCDLWSAQWPFATLMVVDVLRLKAADGGTALNLFRHRVLDGHLHPQNAYFSAEDKEHLLQDLHQTLPDWYNQESIWQQFPVSVGLLEPETMRSIAASPHFTTSVLKSLGHLSPLVAA